MRNTKEQKRIYDLERECEMLKRQNRSLTSNPGESPFVGCSDGGCIVKKPDGMHTNGGCHCVEDRIAMRRLVQWLRLRDSYLRSVVEIQRGEIAELERGLRLIGMSKS